MRKTNQIKQIHTKPNPIYEQILDQIKEELDCIISILGESTAVNVELGVNQSYLALKKLRNSLEEN